jgi:Holliday junction resolvase RusA-like endonuclease
MIFGKCNIKPLSVNKCWQGKRFKTPQYKKYEQELLYILKPQPLPEPPYYIVFDFYMSSSLSDWDNPIKPLQDILQKKYGFNDKDVVTGIGNKHKVKKGEEGFTYQIMNTQEYINYLCKISNKLKKGGCVGDSKGV